MAIHPGRIAKPRRFDLTLGLRGKTWRRIPLDVSPEEGIAGKRADLFSAPSLKHFGVDTPSVTAGILMDYQVAQKLHACTDPNTTEHPNDRVRDVVDLNLLRDVFYEEQHDMTALCEACLDLFAFRELEADKTGYKPSRSWPPTVVAHPHWNRDYNAFAKEVKVGYSLEDAVARLNGWIDQIDSSGGNGLGMST
jgi:hypothetical protein